MKKTVIILSILALIAGSCGQATNKQKQAEVVNNEEIVSKDEEQTDEVELDMRVIPQFPEDSNIKTNVEISLSHDDEREKEGFKSMLSEEWFDFYQDSITKKYYLKKADIRIESYYNDCWGDSVKYVESQRKPLVFVKGIIPQNEEIFSIPVTKRCVWVGEKYSFSFKEKIYIFRGDGNTIKSEMAHTDDGYERRDEVKNYKLYLSEQGKSEQLIVAIPTFNDTFVKILWIGDLDGDGKPDFILDTSRHYEEETVLLFLSSKAGNGEIVKIVASSSYGFAC